MSKKRSSKVHLLKTIVVVIFLHATKRCYVIHQQLLKLILIFDEHQNVQNILLVLI